MAKCSFNDVFHQTAVVDPFVLSFCKGKYALPSKVKHKKEHYGGGAVLDPVPGLHMYTFVKDFKALYR